MQILYYLKDTSIPSDEKIDTMYEWLIAGEIIENIEYEFITGKLIFDTGDDFVFVDTYERIMTIISKDNSILNFTPIDVEAYFNICTRRYFVNERHYLDDYESDIFNKFVENYNKFKRNSSKTLKNELKKHRYKIENVEDFVSFLESGEDDEFKMEILSSWQKEHDFEINDDGNFRHLLANFDVNGKFDVFVITDESSISSIKLHVAEEPISEEANDFVLNWFYKEFNKGR